MQSWFAHRHSNLLLQGPLLDITSCTIPVAALLEMSMPSPQTLHPQAVNTDHKETHLVP